MNALADRRRFGSLAARAAGVLALALAAPVWTGCEDGGDGSSADVGSNDINVAVALGDSITQGGYPSILAGITGKTVVDAGVGGTQASSGAGRIGGLLARHHPGFVLILYGANDIINDVARETTVANLRAMIQAAKGNMTIPVIATLTPMSGSHGIFEPNVEALNEQIRSLASSDGARLANLAGAFGDPGLIGPDGLHPTSAGNNVIASVFAGKIGNRVEPKAPPPAEAPKTSNPAEESAAETGPIDLSL